MMEHKNPFGENKTKRYVSDSAEKKLFDYHNIYDSGFVSLVDYMGGDTTVERAATAGHGKNIFPEKPSTDDFINHISSKKIIEPFKSVQLKFQIQAPIETALTLVYEPSSSVNEYSGRYSVMLDTSYIPRIGELQSHMDRETARKAYNLLAKNRKNAANNYKELIRIDMARELARSGLGIDNNTRFYWKMDLPSLAKFVEIQRAKLDLKSHVRDYVEAIAEIASYVAPISWEALLSNKKKNLKLTLPTDDEIVDGHLKNSSWTPEKTRRPTVPGLEEHLFKIKTFLNHGEFQVVDYMGEDSSFAQAARTSYGEGTKTLQDDQHLVRSLIRDLHTSPIEMCELAMESKSPIFVDPRQAGRHRTLDNHGFMGYTPIGSQFYIPPEIELKYQDRKNRQGRGKEMDPEDKTRAIHLLANTFEESLETAKALRELGAPEDVVRRTKGVGNYTVRWRTGDSHNLGHFLMLRLDPHAQKEIRSLAELVDEAHRLHTPTANEALHTYIINGMRLSEKEIKLIREKGFMNQAIDLNKLDNYKGVGFVIKKKDEEGKIMLDDSSEPVKELSREGNSFKGKLEKLIGRGK